MRTKKILATLITILSFYSLHPITASGQFMAYHHSKVLQWANGYVEYRGWTDWNRTIDVTIWDQPDSGGQAGDVCEYMNSDSYNTFGELICSANTTGEFWWNLPGFDPPCGYSGYSCGTWVSEEYTENPDSESFSFEKCDVSRGFTTYTGSFDFSRIAETAPIELYPSRTPQTVIFQIQPGTFYEMRWNDEVGWWTPTNTIDPSAVSIDGKTADCNGEIPVQMTTMDARDVTPSVANEPPWYKFGLPFKVARYYQFTRAYHPAAAAPSLEALQGIYNSASASLATDHDDCIPDMDPVVIRGSPTFNLATYMADSVPVYVDFKVDDWHDENYYQGPDFPWTWFATDFTDPIFNEIDSRDDLYFLLTEGNFAVLKLVTSLPDRIAGASLNYAESTVLPCSALGSRNCAHEWAHTQGLDYDIEDSDLAFFLMYGGNETGAGWVVNRDERSNLE